jgi:hypothetical protein
MSKPRYNLFLRLRCCWRILTGQTWGCYTPDGSNGYKMAWQGMRVQDCWALRQWANEREHETAVGQDLLATALNLNPGIAPAPDA